MLSSRSTISHSFSQLWLEFISRRWMLYLLGAITVLVTNVAQVMSPRIIGWAIDLLKDTPIPALITGATKLDKFTWLFLAFVATHFTLMLGRMGWRICLGRPTHIAGSWLRKKVWNYARFFPQDKLDRDYTVGVLMNASTSDVNQGRFVFGFTLVGLFDIIFLTVLSLAMMFSINTEMTLWTLAIVPFMPPLVRRLANKEMDRFRDAQDYLGEFNDQCSQAVGTIKLQRLTQTGKFWERKLSGSADTYRGKRLHAIFTGLLFFPLMGSSNIFSYVVLFALGLTKVINGSLSVGEFVAMQSYVFLIQDPLLELGFIVSEFQRSRTSVNRLADIYNQTPAAGLLEDGLAVADQPLAYKVQNLNFNYPTEEGPHEVIKDLSFELARQKRLGIVGPIGAGKSTLISILAGLERDFTGKVELYGKNILEYGHLELREHLAIVPQRTFLFADSIRNNVRLDKSQMDDEEVWHFLKVAGLIEDVMKFPDRLDTPLGEWGINLSGGQKQRLTLARAIANHPKVLLLDDCLSAVDTVTEERILKNLDEHLRQTTLVWVAHRESTLKYCDEIIRMGHVQ